MLEPAQIRSARAALGWSARQLADASGLSLRTIQSAESTSNLNEIRKSSLLAIRAALEAAGIEFIVTPDGAPGIVIRSGR